MSMTMLTALQMIGIAAAYFISTLFLPWLLFRRRLAKLSVPVKFMAYSVIGNFYIINLVLLLQLIHLSYRITLIIGTLLPFAIAYWSKNRGHLREKLDDGIDILLRLLEHRLTIKTIFDQLSRKTRKSRKKRTVTKETMFQTLEGLLVLAVVVTVVFIYGKNLFEGYGYQASDQFVHNKWINEMGNNNVFSSGVYPFGFHCIVYYLHSVYGIKTMTLLRLLSLVQAVMIHLMLLSFLKSVCRSRYLPYLATVGYVLFDFFGRGSYSRYGAALPQEYGMIFILPSICFLIGFFKQFQREQTEEPKMDEPEEDGSAAERKRRSPLWRKRPLSDWYLALFAVSVSLTAAIHFYNAIIVGLFCVGAAVGFIPRIVHWKYFKRTVISGISGLLIAAVPMVIGYAEGKGIQGSLYWGLSVISDEESDDGEETQEEIQLYDEYGNLTVEGKLRQSSLYTKSAYVVGRDLLNWRPFLIDAEKEVYDIDAVILWGKILISFAPAMVLMGMAGCLLGGKGKNRTREYSMTVISMGVYIGLLFMLLCSSRLGLPELMGNARTIVFLAYSLMAAAGLFLDAAISFAFCPCKGVHARNAASLAVSVAVICLMVQTHMIKEPLTPHEEFGTKEAVLCAENILRDNRGRNFTWTVVSANNETEMLRDYGRHYETITFLRDMREIAEEPELTIPTETVYFFIEKLPVKYAGVRDAVRYVSEEGAAEPLYETSTIGAYQGTNRWVTMSHMYYWAREFQKRYPNEMEVYYETDRFVCYRLRQNPYSLFNFAMDYGYNDPQEGKTGEESRGETA